MNDILKNYSMNFSSKLGELYSYYKDTENEINELDFLNLTFQVTENCNLQCSYCYQHNKTKKVMDFEIAKIFIDKLLRQSPDLASFFDFSKKGVILDFIGGEALLQVELIDKIVDYFIEQMIILKHPWLLKFRVHVGSNGVLYFTEKVQNFIKKHKNHLSLSITLDGNQELHDMCRKDCQGNNTYSLVEKAAIHYKENYNELLSTKLTLSPDNISYLFDGIKNFIDLGFKGIFFNPVYEEGWTYKHAIIYYEQLKKLIDYIFEQNLEDKIYLSQLNNSEIGKEIMDDKNWCGGTSNHMAALDTEGNIYPCIRYMPSSLGDNQEPFILGNYQDGTGYDLTTLNRINLLKSITRTSQSDEKCLKCPIQSGCGWCSGYNYELYGTPNKRATFICVMHQARVLTIKYFYNKYSIKHKEKNQYELLIPEEWALNIISQHEYNKLKEGET